MSTIHKATQPSDFLAAVPALLGFQPTDSVVVVPFADSLTVGAMRFDLPSAENAAHVANVAAGMVCKMEGATGLALVVYGERTEAEVVSAAMTQTAAECGLRMVGGFYVTGAGWGLIGGDVVSPMPEVPAPLVALVPDGDQRCGAALPEVDEALAREVAAAIPADLSIALATQGTDPLGLIEAALSWDGSALEAQSVAALIAVMNRPALRDVALVQWAHGLLVGASALHAQIAWEGGTEYPRHLAAVMWGEGSRPDAERLRAALTACRHLAALAPGAAQVGPLAAAAWLSWALGRSTHAEVYARRALAIDAEHGLSQIVASFVAAGHLPEFVFTR
ncbi:DUF4192 family protein [Microbacterium testaceum]|uniref:DUF4192 family protein n=1 Tax=Microbacterium testaceum TaxID=2033 RepID=UPI002AC778A6|nr:DUF4192 family protein [Microbacterium testaceum]MDZ5146116.1 DUF4192 domain-containing protein [Microbacterium testaceum]